MHGSRMLSRKESSSGCAGGADRSRVGERLQAAVAGLQELHLLRDRQSHMVHWALGVDREEPVSSVHAGPEDPRMMMIGAEEQRLEATLTALKQQLCRLRKQDVGLKSHLQQLDQQISELKLDVNKASSEQHESDSRPSSGFYELSDGGSCSRSNSCTSVYSECLSSSQTSLLLPPMSPAASHLDHPPHVDVSRRRSADENSTQPGLQRTKGLHLGSSRIRPNTNGPELARPRPVSAGDLDRMMVQATGPSYHKPADPKNPSICLNLKTTTADPKFHSNLVSRNGAEVYHYPSPLHAVALQSPIFSLGCELATPGLLVGQRPPMIGSETHHRALLSHDDKMLGYIDKLVQRSFGKIHSEMGSETLRVQNQRKPPETVFSNVSQKEGLVMQTLPAQSVIPPDTNPKRPCMTYCSQEAPDNANHKVSAPEASHRYSYPTSTREYSSDEVTVSSLRKNEKNQGEYAIVVRSHSERRCGDNLERKGHRSPAVGHSSSTEDTHGCEFQAPHSTSPQFVHAKYVPAGSQRVKVRQADRKTKSVKLKRKGSEKPRALSHHQSYSSGERTREPSGGSKGEQKRSVKGKVTQKPTTEKCRQGSGSDSSHCSPMYTQKVYPKPGPNPAVCKSNNKQQRLQSEMEMFQPSCAYRRRSRAHPPQPHMVHSLSTMSSQWMGPHHPFHSSMSSNSFLHNLNTRYPPAPFHSTSHYPPRCESEYSAECASLFHSTIAESSEGEMSDNTTNRFGDSESSQSFQSISDSDSSFSVDEEEEEGDLVWAEVALGPTVAGMPLQQQPPPSACRIKASRALKKKIRRFQPASLKVMTLV